MTRHNATWSEEQYYNSDELDVNQEDPDTRNRDFSERGYWDYEEE